MLGGDEPRSVIKQDMTPGEQVRATLIRGCRVARIDAEQDR